MKRQGIKNLILDFGGVLIDLDRARCIEHFKKLELPQVEVMLDLYHQQDFFHNYEKGLISTADFRNVLRQKMGKPVTDAQIDEAWNSFLLSIPNTKLDLLLELRRHFMVYLLSNTNDLHWQWSCQHVFPYKGFRVEDYFEQIFLSYEMKMAKPDADIFEKVLADTGVNPAETLFIDDSEANCLTAQQLGISTYTPKAGEDWSHLFTLD